MSIAEKLTTIAENVPKVYEAGQDELWDGIVYDERKDYAQQFKGWQIEHMRPKNKITPVTVGSANQMLRGNTLLKEVESKHFDFSQLETGTSNQEGFYYTFYGCSALTTIEDVGIGTNNPICSFNYTFNGCTALQTVAQITVAETTRFSNTFNACRQLVNLTIKGTIGQGGLDLHWSPLSKTSIESVIGALSETTTTQNPDITLSKAAVDKAFETDKGLSNGSSSADWFTLVGTKKKWTISLM